MSDIKFTNDEKTLIVAKIQKYFRAQLDQEIGAFDAEFLLDFFGSEVGSFFYNRGLADARDAIEAQVENVYDALYALERPTRTGR